MKAVRMGNSMANPAEPAQPAGGSWRAPTPDGGPAGGSPTSGMICAVLTWMVIQHGAGDLDAAASGH